MVRAELKWLHSPDVYDRKRYSPKEADNFGFLLQAMIGPQGAEGEESFDFLVCTPEWLKRNHVPSDIVVGRHHLIVFRYEYESLVDFISAFIRQFTGDSWNDVAQKLCRLGKWEFEDYRESGNS